MLCRVYEPADRQACVAAFRSCTPPYFRREDLSRFRRFIDHLPGPYFVVQDEKEVIGCGGYAMGPLADEAAICWLIVNRRHHGQGVGSFLMTECVAGILNREGCNAVRLETSQHTRGFFERWGFATRAVTPNGFGSGLDRVEMRMVLDDAARARWHQMITGGLPPPDTEQPIPAIESYKEWAANRYNPGHYLGGRLEPHLDQLRTGPEGKRFAGLLLGVSATMATVGLLTTFAFGVPERIVGLALVAVSWIAAVRMYRKGSAPDGR